MTGAANFVMEVLAARMTASTAKLRYVVRAVLVASAYIKGNGCRRT